MLALQGSNDPVAQVFVAAPPLDVPTARTRNHSYWNMLTSAIGP
jgi:hypothetical protein